MRSSAISIGNTVGNYDIIYSGIVITEICNDSSCNVERNYTVDYVITNSWANNQTVEITITNIGDKPIRNWALQYDHHGIITNLWNGVLHSRNIIKSQMYNSDIAPGGSVTFGYILTNVTGTPSDFSLCTQRAIKQNGFTVDISVINDWGDGYTGAITITNTSNKPIMAWELGFDANFKITQSGNFLIIEDSNGYYKLAGSHNGNIPINSSITLQFNGVMTTPPALSNIVFSEMII